MMPFQPLPCEADAAAAAADPCGAPVATVGLCLADATPIAVIARADCDADPEVVGWLNLTTGAFTGGAPPAGTVACSQAPQGAEVAAALHRQTFDGGPAPFIVDLFASYASGPVESVTVTVPVGADPPEIETSSGFSVLFPGEIGDVVGARLRLGAGERQARGPVPVALQRVRPARRPHLDGTPVAPASPAMSDRAR